MGQAEAILDLDCTGDSQAQKVGSAVEPLRAEMFMAQTFFLSGLNGSESFYALGFHLR